MIINRQYSPQLVSDANWEEAEVVFSAEFEAVRRIASAARTCEEFDEIAREEGGEVIVDEVIGDFVMAPDLGSVPPAWRCARPGV